MRFLETFTRNHVARHLTTLCACILGALAFTSLGPWNSSAASEPMIAGVPERRPHDIPQIVQISPRAPIVSGGEHLRVRIETTSNVASVEARMDGFGQNLQRLGVGRWLFSYQVPQHLPPLLKHAYNMQFIARNVDGIRTTREISVTLR